MSSLIEKYILEGWIPHKPTGDRSYYIITTPDNMWDIHYLDCKALEDPERAEKLSKNTLLTLIEANKLLNALKLKK